MAGDLCVDSLSLPVCSKLIRFLSASSQACRVTAHSVPTDQFPRRTVFLIALNKSVMEREEALASLR
jgi:hypothetical protein